MIHKTTTRFWVEFYKLPRPIQKLARKNYDLLLGNVNHPSLHFKKVGNLWSVRIGLSHRALAMKDGDDYIWVWIGTHEAYNHLLKS